MQGLPKFEHPDLLVGTEGYSDAGVYRLRDDLLMVQSLDFFPPLVDDPFVYGQIAAANSLSDVYTMGAQPTTAMNIVGFPDDKLELEVLGEILRGGADRVKQAGAVLVGGHSVRDVEIKYGLSVTGIVSPDYLLTNQGAKPGDVLVLTKALGTGFVTTAFKMSHCEQSVIDAAINGMIQLNSVGSEAASKAEANAATDITGFGLGGHANEMAQSSGVTVELFVGKLPLLPGASELAAAGNMTRASASNRSFTESATRIDDQVDQLRLEFIFDAQTSGGLLISVPENRADELIRLAKDGGAESTCVVGAVRDKQEHSLVILP